MEKTNSLKAKDQEITEYYLKTAKDDTKSSNSMSPEKEYLKNKVT